MTKGTPLFFKEASNLLKRELGNIVDFIPGCLVHSLKKQVFFYWEKVDRILRVELASPQTLCPKPSRMLNKLMSAPNWSKMSSII